MNDFVYRNGELHCEDVSICKIAEKVKTPFYLYSQETFKRHYHSFFNAFKDLNPSICYSIKNCSNIHILKFMIEQGAGIDVVSGGELYRALKAGVDPEKIVYAGVGKTDKELVEAMNAKIGWFNIESEEEFQNVSRIAAEMDHECKVALRINPNIYDKETHEKTATGIKDSKFGVDASRVKKFFERYGNDKYVKLKGVHIHIGSPIYTSEPYEKAIIIILSLIEELLNNGFNIEMIDIGGGFIAHYDGNEKTKSWNEYSSKIIPILKPFVDNGGQVILEPGRGISANAGVLISQIQYTKTGVNKKFLIMDTGMSHILRPAMYDAYHFIWPTSVAKGMEPVNYHAPEDKSKLKCYDIVGPICESSDYLGKDRLIPSVKRGDLLCVFTAGAYCMTMANQYNSTPRPPEVLVDGSKVKIIRERENYDDLIEKELVSREVEI